MLPGAVIVGAGQAGFQTALSLRSEGYVGPITLIGEESRLPYARPPLSKAFLKNDADPETLEYRPAAFFTEHRIDCLFGERVIAFDRGSKVLRIASGGEIPWSHLVLATGARVRTLSGTRPDVHYVRTTEDSLVLRQALRRGGELSVIGGGFIGLEVAAAARSMGMSVQVTAAEARLMGRAVSPFISQWFAALHDRHGVSLRMNTMLRDLDDPSLTGEVVVGIGVIPNIEIARDAGLEVFDGIVTDSFLRTSDPSIFAVGDCALHPNPYAGGLIRIESVQNAADQARAVASTIAGKPREYRQVPWFWTEQFEAKLQIAGIPHDDDEIEVRGDVEVGKFSVYSYRHGELRAVESVNRPADHIAARKSLEALVKS